jgi:Spirocyclase AveC-like
MLISASGVITSPPTAGWLFGVIGPLLWVALAGYFIRECREQRCITRNTLLFIATTTMWWQEWFGDWATYLIYNPHFALIPWGSTMWTTPNKPWAVIPAYGWYYTLSFLALFWIVGRIRARQPHLAAWKVAALVGLPVFYLADLFIEGGAAFLGMWSYDQFVGPALQSPAGNFPLLYPVVFFSGWCTLMGALVYHVDATGFTQFDRLLGMRRWLSPTERVDSSARLDSGGVATLTATAAHTQPLSIQAQAVRIILWVAGFNLSYWTVFIFPMILIRMLTGAPSSLIP